MQHQLVDDHGEAKTWVIVLDEGDEVAGCLLDFARSQRLSGAHFTAIGAFQKAVLGYFEWDRRDYRRNLFERQLEVVSLIGDVSLKDGEPKVHMHAVLGQDNGGALGGHLLEGHVRPTLEIVLTESPAHLHRRYDSHAGIALIKLDRPKTGERQPQGS